jgi:drug/metabolite transporter (DMT)-like permease
MQLVLPEGEDFAIGAAGIILAFLGVVTIVARSGLSLGYFSMFGNLLCMGSVFSWTAYSVYGKQKLREASANEITDLSARKPTVLTVG